ncbi:ankyrin repeat-containing domain protein, partial [Ilyonectria destructans]
RKLSVTPLILAAAEGRDAVVCVLLGFSDINQQSDSGITALFMALYYGQVDTAKMLLRQGANVEACGFNALHAAARSGSCDMITHLVEDCQVDVNVEDCDGATALFYALQQPEDEALETILHMQRLGLLKDAKLDCCWTFEEIARAMGKQSLTSVFEVDKELT